jgi:hypothetical protein
MVFYKKELIMGCTGNLYKGSHLEKQEKNLISSIPTSALSSTAHLFPSPLPFNLSLHNPSFASHFPPLLYQTLSYPCPPLFNSPTTLPPFQPPYPHPLLSSLSIKSLLPSHTPFNHYLFSPSQCLPPFNSQQLQDEGSGLEEKSTDTTQIMQVDKYSS